MLAVTEKLCKIHQVWGKMYLKLLNRSQEMSHHSLQTNIDTPPREQASRFFPPTMMTGYPSIQDNMYMPKFL